jgi:hypothetical protein
MPEMLVKIKLTNFVDKSAKNQAKQHKKWRK